jgi:hypothetical protein
LARHIHYLRVPHTGFAGVAVFEYKSKSELVKAQRWLRSHMPGYWYWVKVKADTVHFDWNYSQPEQLIEDTRIMPYYNTTLTQQTIPYKTRARTRSIAEVIEAVEDDNLTKFYIRKIHSYYLYVDLTVENQRAWNINLGFLR